MQPGPVTGTGATATGATAAGGCMLAGRTAAAASDAIGLASVRLGSAGGVNSCARALDATDAHSTSAPKNVLRTMFPSLRTKTPRQLGRLSVDRGRTRVRDQAFPQHAVPVAT